MGIGRFSAAFLNKRPRGIIGHLKRENAKRPDHCENKCPRDVWTFSRLK